MYGLTCLLQMTGIRPGKELFVVLVSQSFVRRYRPGGNPLGRHINIGNYDRTIVGVMGDVHVRTLEAHSESVRCQTGR